jgi:Ni/Fe-hydrogenase subunit HybB-like protein
LFLEFIPVVLEKFGLQKPLGWIKLISVPLMIVGVILSTLHQSSLGSLYLIVPHKLYPLWYTPILPVLFYFSAICVGLAMTIFESWHSSRAFGRQLELPLLASMGRVLAVLLMVLTLVRFLDLHHRGVLPLLLQNRPETWLFGLEALLMVAPMILLFFRGMRLNPGRLYFCAVLFIFGFVTNRLNVSITGMEAGSGTHYIPRWTEIAVTLMIVAIGFAVFRIIAQYFPIFEAQHEEAVKAAAREGRVEVLTGV